MGEIADIKNAYNWNITRIAEAFDMDRGTVRRKIRAAGITPAARANHVSLYALKDAVPALYRRDPGPQLPPDDMDPQSRRAWFQSENERVRFEGDMSHLIPAVDVTAETSRLARAMLDKLETFPRILERECGLKPDAVAHAEKRVSDLRARLAPLITRT